MSVFLLAIEPDNNSFSKITPLWEKHDVFLDCVASMQEAIKVVNETG